MDGDLHNADRAVEIWREIEHVNLFPLVSPVIIQWLIAKFRDCKVKMRLAMYFNFCFNNWSSEPRQVLNCVTGVIEFFFRHLIFVYVFRLCLKNNVDFSKSFVFETFLLVQRAHSCVKFFLTFDIGEGQNLEVSGTFSS